MKNILITGGSGFIGRNLKEQLEDRYNIFAPSSTELNLLDRSAVDAYLKTNKISDVVHCAVYNQKRREDDPKLDLDANLKMFYNLAEQTSNLDKLIYFGSGAEYDKRNPICMAKEEDVGRSIPTMNDYSLSKYIMNLEARRSQNIYNLRLFGVFGKYEDWEHCFISNLCCKAVLGLPLTIRKECVFDFIFIDHILPVIEWVLENKPRFHDYNVCSGKAVQLTEIAHYINELSKNRLEMKLLSNGIGNEYTASNDRLNCEFNVSNLSENIFTGIYLLYQYYSSKKNEINFEILKNSH